MTTLDKQEACFKTQREGIMGVHKVQKDIATSLKEMINRINQINASMATVQQSLASLQQKADALTAPRRGLPPPPPSA